MADRTLIAVSHQGLGEILRTRKLSVPPNQREYSWTSREVTTLFQDFASAIQDGEGDYFLGTIVVVQKEHNVYEIVDGQQRLATTAILIAAMRDFLRDGEPEIATTIDRDYLRSSSRSMRELEPRIRLNLADNQFFEALMDKSTRGPTPSKPSHILLQSAFEEAGRYVRKITAAYEKKTHGDLLVRWLDFIRDSAQVVMLTISSDGNAYRMFETLNDRGLKTTQADLVKNYLFGRAGGRLEEAQSKWSSMRALLDTLDEDAIPTVTFLRHSMMLFRGYFRENALHDNIQAHAKSEAQVISLLASVEDMAGDYAALFNADSERWNGYPDAIRHAIRVLSLLNIAGFRPLMLAVAAKFTPKEAATAFRKFVSWKVRYLIAGSTLTGGYIEVPLAAAAKKVFDGEIGDAVSLSREMNIRLPSDEQFQKTFSEATVSKTSLARYYLRSLEMVAKGQKEPEFIPNDDSSAINLEHVLPMKPMGNWPSFNDSEASADVKRIGNMVLMQAKQNSDLRSAPFSEKKSAFLTSPYELTAQVGRETEWNHETVLARQGVLAKLALKAWPL